MIKTTQAIRDEHAALGPSIAGLADTGDAVGRCELPELRRRIDDSYRFLTRELIPHSAVEEEVIYPLLRRILKSPELTATMQRDHIEVRMLTTELAALKHRLDAADELTGETAAGLRRVLYGLYHVVTLHLAKEEEVYFPLLERHLSQPKARQMFEDMDRVALQHRVNA